MKNRLNKKVIAIALFGVLFGLLNAATHNQNYNVLGSDSNITYNDSKFMDGDFEAIYRFDMIVIDDKEIVEASQATLKDAVAKAHELQKNGKDFDITLLGHTQQTNDDANEKRIESDSYASSLQNLFSKDFTSNESMNLSQEYVKIVEKKLLDENIAKEKISLEARGAQDQIFTEIYEDEKEESHGVFLSIYVAKKEEVVVEQKSEVVEQKEIEKATPKEIQKEKSEVPLVDVVDFNDSQKSLPKETLRLNFETNSDKILQNSYGEIQRFAVFLKEYPEYNAEIVGHTDSRGKAVLNMDLSERRALMTKRALVEEGVDASRLRVRGRGELEPIESNLTLEGREANRRIEVELFLQK